MTSAFDHGTRPECRISTLALLIALGAPLGAHAQSSRTADASTDMSRMIGLSVAASGGPRDTLGLLIASVTRDGPADQAGITTGSRILAVNGLLVRLAPADIGRRAAADSALVKFDRALRITPPGRDVMLRVAGGGMTRLVNVPFGERRSGAERVVPPAVVADVAPQSIDSNVPRAVASMSASPPTATAPSAPERMTPSIEPPSVARRAMPQIATTPSAVAVPTAHEPRSVDTLADALGDVQLELRRLARDSHSLAMSDSLADLDAAVGTLRRRMRALAADAPPATVRSDSAPRSSSTAAASATTAVPPSVSTAKIAASGATTRPGAPGLELAKVSGELAAYLGAQGDSALTVVRASEAWEPMRVGDVIIRMDGAAPDPERLRNAFEFHRRIGVTLLRRGRSFTVILGESDTR